MAFLHKYLSELYYQTTWHIFGTCKHTHTCTQAHIIFIDRIINFSLNNEHMLIIFLVELICSRVLEQGQITDWWLWLCIRRTSITADKWTQICNNTSGHPNPATPPGPCDMYGWVPCAGHSGKVCSSSQCSCYLRGESRAGEKGIFLPLPALTSLSAPLHPFPVFWPLREASCISGV